MGKRKDKKQQKAAAGLHAQATGYPYHTNSEEDRNVYHTRPDCPTGLEIENKHLRAGAGSGRDLCEDCDRLAREATT